MTHILKGQLKLATEEANREKAFKQVAKSTLRKKVRELAHIEQRAIIAERA